MQNLCQIQQNCGVSEKDKLWIKEGYAQGMLKRIYAQLSTDTLRNPQGMWKNRREENRLVVVVDVFYEVVYLCVEL